MLDVRYYIYGVSVGESQELGVLEAIACSTVCAEVDSLSSHDTIECHCGVRLVGWIA